ncbi:DUF3696 domain-containing protein [Candidatus Sumerlaeota bacterium]|nr:DUF3696 domain-containing protein [Candidatus Sumerlaeota bacterium]
MARNRERITKIIIRGFKSIYERQEIDIRPLTILAGANSSGKSSVIQPILLLKQTIEAPSDPGALLLDGPNVRFTKAEQLISHILGKNVLNGFTAGLEIDNESRLEIEFKREKKTGYDVSSMLYSSNTEKKPTKITPEMSHDDIVKLLPTLAKFNQNIDKTETQWIVIRKKCFLSFELFRVSDKKKIGSFGNYGIVYGSNFIPHIEALIHLPGLRGNPRRTYPKSAMGPLFPGTFENYAASIISEWQAKNDDRLKQLGAALEEMGLTWKVKAERLDDTQVEIRVGRLTHGKRGGASDLVSIADVGFGVSQSLPVVTALIAAKPDQIVYLEQPEIHLHPNAQRKLAHILKNAAERGVIVIIETHSSLLLREIQTLVAAGSLDKDLVKLHWFQRQDDGLSKIHSAELDENGAFGDWPEDFDEVELDAEKSYLDAVGIREGIS